MEIMKNQWHFFVFGELEVWQIYNIANLEIEVLPMAQFGEMLSELRQDKKITQEQLGNAIFVTAGTVSNYENNVHLPDVEKLVLLADYFDVTVDYLLGRSQWNLSPQIFQEMIAPDKTLGDFVEMFSKLSEDRKRALLLILKDMQLGMWVSSYNTKEST